VVTKMLSLDPKSEEVEAVVRKKQARLWGKRHRHLL